jgi:hypothetical protein
MYTVRGCNQNFRTGRLGRELKIVQLSATRCSCTAILWVSLVSFAAITFLCCFSTSIYCCCWFRYWLSPETFGYILVCVHVCFVWNFSLMQHFIVKNLCVSQFITVIKIMRHATEKIFLIFHNNNRRYFVDNMDISKYDDWYSEDSWVRINNDL